MLQCGGFIKKNLLSIIKLFSVTDCIVKNENLKRTRGKTVL